MWSEIKSDPDFGHYYPPEIYTESLMTTFENEWDVMPEGRHKGGFQLEFVSISRVINHMPCYKF